MKRECCAIGSSKGSNRAKSRGSSSHVHSNESLLIAASSVAAATTAVASTTSSTASATSITASTASATRVATISTAVAPKAAIVSTAEAPNAADADWATIPPTIVTCIACPRHRRCRCRCRCHWFRLLRLLHRAVERTIVEVDCDVRDVGQSRTSRRSHVLDCTRLMRVRHRVGVASDTSTRSWLPARPAVTDPVSDPTPFPPKNEHDAEHAAANPNSDTRFHREIPRSSRYAARKICCKRGSICRRREYLRLATTEHTQIAPLRCSAQFCPILKPTRSEQASHLGTISTHRLRTPA